MSVISPEAKRDSAAPRASRLQAPGWRNPRLLVGLLLVFASIAAGARVIAAADQTVPVFAARRTLATGTVLSAADLSVVRLRLTGTDAAYLDANRPVPGGRVLVRPVGAGEPVPVAALVPASQLRLRPVSIPLDGPASGLAPGGLVDIWASAKAQATMRSTAEGAYLDAQRIASAVEIAAVESESRALAAGTSAAVQVLVPAETLPAVLNALANEARIAVLPIPGAGAANAGDGEQPGSGGDTP